MPQDMLPVVNKKKAAFKEAFVETVSFARASPEVLADWLRDNPELQDRVVKVAMLGAFQVSEAVASPNALALKLDNVWNDVVYAYSEHFALELVGVKHKRELEEPDAD